MKRKHVMPFGAEIGAGGRTAFRLWAPAAKAVDLCLEGGIKKSFLPMEPSGGGWYRIRTSQAQPGRLYRFRIDGGLLVPDPASRFQPEDALGPSQLIDPEAWEWDDGEWRGRPWEEAIFYELHVGTYTPRGRFSSLIGRLDYLAELGVTAIQVMPVNSFPGRRNWGYDGVLLFAPEDTYGHPEDFKRFVQEAHKKGLMVFLDVVYNHFGPLGNYLNHYAPQFFTDRHKTPWGDAINFDTGPESRTVRDFFVHNALYWLEEFNLDGLRFDATDWLIDTSTPDFITEMGDRIRKELKRDWPAHLVLENDENVARYLISDEGGGRRYYNAQWNEDLHHVLHLLATGEESGYYIDYRDDPIRHLGRSLTEGFAYQGEGSSFRGGRSRGSNPAGLPATAFVCFLQNHDQVGNRPFGERLSSLAAPEAIRAVTAVFLIQPQPPLIFMGQEFRVDNPFYFFCDLSPELAPLISQGRREFFAKMPQFKDLYNFEEIPDPSDEQTFQNSTIDLLQMDDGHPHREWLNLHRTLIEVRKREVIPRLPGIAVGSGGFERLGDRAISVHWILDDGAKLSLFANLGEKPVRTVRSPEGLVIFETHRGLEEKVRSGEMPPWSVLWLINTIQDTA